MPPELCILTIGHSTRPLGTLIELLQRHSVALLADVRRFPASRTQPQFNRESLPGALREAGIGYAWHEALGGRRRAAADSHNTRWRNASFRGYADYMETPAFAAAYEALTTSARQRRTALMCAEVLWWRCHRSLLADLLQSQGWTVQHIGPDGELVPHPYTAAAWLDHGRLRYDGDPAQPSLAL
jgi:uncharacterized protein (DUF488 family)